MNEIPLNPEFEIPALMLKVAAKLSQCPDIQVYWMDLPIKGVLGGSSWDHDAEAPEIRLVHNGGNADAELWVFLHEIAHCRHHREFLFHPFAQPADPHDIRAVKGSGTPEGLQAREREAQAQAGRWKEYAEANCQEYLPGLPVNVAKLSLQRQLLALLDLADDSPISRSTY